MDEDTEKLLGINSGVEEKKTSTVTKKKKKPGNEEFFREAIKYPWVPAALARKLVTMLTISVFCTVIISMIMMLDIHALLGRKPWIYRLSGGKYTDVSLEQFHITRDDVEIYCNLVVPKLYASSYGEAPGLELIKTLVNANIVATQKRELTVHHDELKRGAITQYAIVTGIKPETLVIDRQKKIVYVEAVGLVGLTKEDKSITNPVQWQCLIYVVDPISNPKSPLPGGRVVGNEMGLYLNQIVEQKPGTINENVPKPSTADEQERREQEESRNRDKVGK